VRSHGAGYAHATTCGPTITAQGQLEPFETPCLVLINPKLVGKGEANARRAEGASRCCVYGRACYAYKSPIVCNSGLSKFP
jgi:hypothetical protein